MKIYNSDGLAENMIDPAILPPEDRKRASIRNYMKFRQKCRTDLIWLCQNVLGYKDVDAEVHGPIADALQAFKGGIDKYTEDGQFVEYTPYVQLWDLKTDDKDTLILYPRGHLKTTIIDEAHSIQWVINYPDIRIALDSATGDLVEAALDNVKKHFTHNEAFRYFFPEFCPAVKDILKFGNGQEFTVPCRKKRFKEATICIMTVGKPRTGFHFEVVKPDDVVYPENVKSKTAIVDVCRSMADLTPLRETAKDGSGKIGWLDVSGTRYDFSDYYGMVIKAEEARRRNREAAENNPNLSADERAQILDENAAQWKIVIEPAIRMVNGERVALWPKGMPLRKLDQIRNKPEVGSAMFNAQYMLNPIADGQGLAKEEDIVWVTRKTLNELKPRLREFVTIDLAQVGDSKRSRTSDFHALVHGGWDSDGRLYINDIRHGQFGTDKVIANMFDLYRLNPRITCFKIQKDLISDSILPWLRREMVKRGCHLPILPLSVSGTNKNTDRIQALQPYFEGGLIRFAEDLKPSVKMALIDEIQYFPKYAHDDILDAIADFVRSADGISYDMVPAYKEVERDGDEIIGAQDPDIFGEQEEPNLVGITTGW